MFPGNIDFADDQGALSCCIHVGLMCLFMVCEAKGVASPQTCRPGPTNFWFDPSTAFNKLSSPAKIFHQNSSGERRLKFIASEEDDDNKKP